MKPRLSFHGGVGTVTGSRFLVRSGEHHTLVDAGLFQGLKKLRQLNWRRPSFEPSAIDQLLLTHAHIDHSGYLPRLVREGLDCPVYCTPATLDLAHLLLMDAAKIQEEDAVYANRKGYSKHRPALPLYTTQDAEKALALLRPIQYEEWLDLGDGHLSRFLNAGHILGAAAVELRIPKSNDPDRAFLFSGDVGRYGVPLHSDPAPPPRCDWLVIESTYGDRAHDPKPLGEQIREPFRRTFERGGTVLIPSFAVGRTQLITLILRDLMKRNELSEVPIHIDSPMAVDATRIYSRHLADESLDEELSDDGRVRLFPTKVRFHRTVQESKELNELAGPRIVISSSGMLTAGRVLHHLRHLLPDPSNLLMLVGFQAAGTRGRALLEGARTLKMHGREVPVKAEFLNLHGLSAHADADELMTWLASGEGQPGTVFVTHGEPSPAGTLAQRIEKEFGCNVFVPELDQAFEL